MTAITKPSKGKSGRRARANVDDYTVEAEWSADDKRMLAEYLEREKQLPADAPRALISIRLSVLTEETTSPVRTELDLRKKALDDGYRVIGVASDLNVSATKVAPWKRKGLGEWLNDRVPEFDALYFWKIDRFVRNVNDLNAMIVWAQKRQKNIVSLHDPIDLSNPLGIAVAGLIGAFAQIEAGNTTVRISSLWEYNKRSDEWHIGKPPYGYRVTEEDGKNKLAFYAPEYDCLKFMYDRLVTDKLTMTAACRAAVDAGHLDKMPSGSTMTRRLRNPALMGYRVEENKDSWLDRSKLVYDTDGQPIRVGPAIFTRTEFDDLQSALAALTKQSPVRERQSPTRFLGVFKCADCGSNITVRIYRRGQHGDYAYLICRHCPNGGAAVPNPQAIYDQFAEQITALLGKYEIAVREYARGAEVRARVNELKETIASYMKGLEPGGRYTKTKFTQQQAEATIDAMIAELEAIDPEETEDRWVQEKNGLTYAEHWDEGGMDAMTEDLVRAGITCVLTRTKVANRKPPEVTMDLRIPDDVKDRLVIRPDEFADRF